MRILAVETSCDETAVAVLEFCEDASSSTMYTLLGERLHSQASKHAPYGGVYPNLAKREHQKILPPLVSDLLSDLSLLRGDPSVRVTPEISSICSRESVMLQHITSLFSGKRLSSVDALAVTQGPGLSPALWVGVNFIRSLSLLWNIPLIPVNHMEGHIVSALLDSSRHLVVPSYPLLSLLVSGGHTELVLADRPGVYRKIGRTIDDAAGEAFDKAARLLGLPYPGGPALSALAARAREQRVSSPVSLPRPMLQDSSFNFSYSGLKTALRLAVEQHSPLSEDVASGLALEFECAVVETLLEKTRRALEHYAPKTLVVGGGVSANQYLRDSLVSLLARYPSVSLHLPDATLATDNAVMIALAAYLHRDSTVDPRSFGADPNLSFLDATSESS